MARVPNVQNEQILLAELQVLLAQLRTHLSMVRTGAGLLVGTVTVAFLLLTNYSLLPPELKQFVYVTSGGLGSLALLGLFIFAHSERKILKISRLIRDTQRHNKRISRLIV